MNEGITIAEIESYKAKCNKAAGTARNHEVSLYYADEVQGCNALISKIKIMNGRMLRWKAHQSRWLNIY